MSCDEHELFFLVGVSRLRSQVLRSSLMSQSGGSHNFFMTIVINQYIFIAYSASKPGAGDFESVGPELTSRLSV